MLSGDVGAQVDEAVSLLRTWGALDALHHRHGAASATSTGLSLGVDAVPAVAAVAAGAPEVAVVVEPGRPRIARELLGEAVQHGTGRGRRRGGHRARPGRRSPPRWRALQGADGAVTITGTAVEEDVAAALVRWCGERAPWAVLVPGTLWGREVASRTAARTAAGLTGDAVAFAVEDGRLVAWKPAFGGSLVAAITCTSPLQMATVRPGVLARRAPRPAGAPVPVTTMAGATTVAWW